MQSDESPSPARAPHSRTEDGGKSFYSAAIEETYRPGAFAWSDRPEQHPFHAQLRWLLDSWNLRDGRALEIGPGRGAFQDEMADYTATDIAASVRKWLHKPFVQADARSLPFGDHSFDVVWTNYVLEHVTDPERMLAEVARVTRPAGHFLISARWQAGPWLAEGYPVRPFSDFDWRGKLIKATVPVRSTVAYRAFRLGPRRLLRLISLRLRPRPTRLHYRSLTPNFAENWMPDSTAATSVEPHEVYCWYVSRRYRCLNYPTSLRALVMRTGPLIFQAPAA